MSIDFNQLREFIVAIAGTEITEMTLKSQNFELILKKNATVINTENIEQISQGTVPVLTTAQPINPVNVAPTPSVTKEPPAPTPLEKKWKEITSPMVGTFYRAPAPGEDSFVEINQKIRVGDVVCIIEAMKLMNEIESEITGQVMEVLVENGQPVEYGQTLMWVNPD